jgi:DNA-binding transcriptional MocR family regulator
MHDMWLPSIVDRRGPVYLAIVDDLAHAIQSGTLRAGNRLPAQRLLADLLGINLSTVTRAYSEAERRHLIAGEVGRGTYVLANSREVDLFALKGLPDRASIDLSTNVPPRPAHDADLEQTIATLAQRETLARFLHYPSSGDGAVHRGAAALWLKQRGIVADPARIVICSGAQHGVLTAISSLVSHGDTVLTEEFTYLGMKAIAARLGLKLKGVAMDADGMCVDAFARACRSGVARTAVLMPTLHNPTTSTLTFARRKQLVEIARRFGVTLIEEDVYGLLAKDAVSPLAALAPDSVLYVTSLSKTVAPGLRIGYLYGPAHLINGIAQQVHMTSWLTCPLMAEAIAKWRSCARIAS